MNIPFSIKSFSNSFAGFILALTLGLFSLHGLAAEPDATININTATAEQIAQTLKGVGLKKAKSIVAYRESRGPFKSSEDLLDVKGIGKSTLKRNESRIVVNSR